MAEKAAKRDEKRVANASAGGGAEPTPRAPHTAASRKISSFQITSVTVGARAADQGDDSADDLDESHTDELSRVTDLENETPSFSEDTFSKDDVFYNASSASLGCAPVIPTSAQYGLAIVGQDGAPTPPHAHAADAPTADHRVDRVKPDQVHDQVRNERFKVVKIESTEPFRRGRWTCMDYLDHTSAQPPLVNNVDCSENAECADPPHEDSQAAPAIPKEVHALQNSHADPPHFPVGSPGQSLTHPLNAMQQQPTTMQSPPVELPNQQPATTNVAQPMQQPVSHVPMNASANVAQQSQPVQQIAQSYPSHQLQQTIAQGIPQVQQQQLQMSQQMPQMQTQPPQMQAQPPQMQMPNQTMMHGSSQMSNMTQMQQIPQMQPIQSQNQMSQMPTQQPPMQHLQMQQVPTQQTMHQMQPQMQPIPQQTHHMQTQQQIPNSQPQLQHMQPQSQMHAMQPTQLQSHMQQIPQMSQMNNQAQMHGQPQMHQIPPQTTQVNQQQNQVQQSHPIHAQLQQTNIAGAQHGYGAQQIQQTANAQTLMQPQMTNQTQHIGQQNQVSQPMVQPQHGVPQFYQQPQMTQQGQSLSQEVLSSIVNSQQQTTISNSLQNMNSQPQGTTLPANLQGMATQQSMTMHSINQPPQSMPQNALHMMTQQNQNIPMSMDNGQTNIQIPVSDSIYMQTSNIGQQMNMGQHMNTQQPMMNQVNSSSNQTTHIPQQNQMSMSHVMPSQGIGNQQAVQTNVVNQNSIQNMQNLPNQSMNQQIAQVSMSNVQQSSQPLMQNMVSANQTNVVQHNQNIPMSMQQNLPTSMQPVHTVSTSVVQSQPNVHGQVNMPLGSFNSQGVVGSMQQNVMPVMSQTNMTAPVGMQNTVNNQMDVHISQQNICSTASATQPIISGTNSPVVSLPVSSTINYAPNATTVNAVENQNFGSPVSAVVTHVANTMSSSNIGLCSSDVTNESGGGTPASDGTQTDTNDGKDDMQSSQNEDSESLIGLAMALGGTMTLAIGPQTPSRAASPYTIDHFTHYSASGTSAVAIDNKIEQAMDLVKSHLMFAVREEVEVLKEKIAELMEKINQLELENSILRASATQETLAQLNAPPPTSSPPAGPVS